MSTREGLRWADLEPQFQIPENVAVAEVQWDLEPGDVQDGCKYIRILIDPDAIITALGQRRRDFVSSQREDLEIAIVEAFFNPAYRPPLFGAHPENE